jgi:hypothetical protein
MRLIRLSEFTRDHKVMVGAAAFALLAMVELAIELPSAVSDAYNGARFHPFRVPGNTRCVAWNDRAWEGGGAGRTMRTRP